MQMTINAASGAGIENSGNPLKKSNSVFAGNLEFGKEDTKDLIAQKRGFAQKQAMKLIGNAWDKDSRTKQQIADMQQQKADKVSLLQDYQSRLREVKERKAAIQEAYGIDSDTQEQKDLELLEKYQDYKNGSVEEQFSQEEIARLEELQNIPRTAYQNKVLAENAVTGQIKQEQYQTKRQIMGIQQSITSARLEQLKSQDMQNAEDTAAKIKDAAEDEILGMLVQDGVDHIDEEIKEEEEKAEETGKKEEKPQEKIDEAKEERKEQETILKGAAEADRVNEEGILRNQTDTNVAQAQKSIQKMLQENNLVNEDLKGIQIDFNF